MYVSIKLVLSGSFIMQTEQHSGFCFFLYFLSCLLLCILPQRTISSDGPRKGATTGGRMQIEQRMPSGFLLCSICNEIKGALLSRNASICV